jgi:hypothetical protein
MSGTGKDQNIRESRVKTIDAVHDERPFRTMTLPKRAPGLLRRRE